MGRIDVRPELEKKFEEHRRKAFVTCDETCFCWDIEPLLK